MVSDPHALDLRDRGAEHVHRWWVRCTCGWIGPYRRRRKDAVRIHRQHAEAKRKRARRAGKYGHGPVPRPLTPVDQLPEALR